MIKNRLKTLNYMRYNLQKLTLIPKATKQDFVTNNLFIRGCKLSELDEAERLYKALNGKGFSRINKFLLMLISRKSLIIAIDKSNNKIIAINYFYINHRDNLENTIHEGFIGVLPEYRGQGIATKMREHAKSHFKASGFLGISSRISKNNLSSLTSSMKVGFIPVEKYFDRPLNEYRYYLICNLEKENDIYRPNAAD